MNTVPENPSTKNIQSGQQLSQHGETVVLVLGLSGAGKSTALHVFEDMHLITADGVPPALMPDMVRLLHASAMEKAGGIALGLDQRRGQFAAELDKALHKVSGMGFRVHILFLEADPAVLIRRYATTRRPHPLERENIGLEQAVREEAENLASIREMADRIIDTSTYSIHDLRRRIQRRWNNTQERAHAIKINLVSFGFKYGVPREADIVFDLRFLPNPYFVEELRQGTGKDKAVAAYVFGDPSAKEFKKRFIEFISSLLPLYDAEGRYRITIALGCTGGKHRSVAVAEALMRALKRQDYRVSIEHRHMELG